MPNIVGTAGDDNLIGTEDADSLNGPAGTDGNDTLNGAGGADRLYGGRGNDHLDGGEGDDLFDGGDGGEDPAIAYGYPAVFGGGDMASYRSARNGVIVSLMFSGAQNTGQGLDTLIGIEGLHGSDFGDTLTGNDGVNVLLGFGGSDRLFGGGGNDFLIGGEGDDYTDGGDGHDEMYDGQGDDILLGGDGNDVLNLFSGSGRDQIFAGAGDDVVMVAGGRTLVALDGGSGIDTLWLGRGEVLLSGFSAANGFELFRGGDSISDYFLGTAAEETFDFSGLRAVTVSSLPGFPPGVPTLRAMGGLGRDTLIGLDGGRDVLSGDRGSYLTGDDDILRGLAGDDFLSGDGGNDFVDGGEGNDQIYGGNGDDTLLGGAGDDIIRSDGFGADTIDGGDGDDFVSIGGVVRSLQGGAGIDTLNFGNYQPILSVFSAANGFERFGGDAQLSGTDGADRLDFSSLFAVLPELRLTIQTGLGNDEVRGMRGGQNWLFGQLGDDTLTGGDQNDRLVGGEGADILRGDAGSDLLEGSEGDDFLYGDRGDDTLMGGAGADRIEGGDGQDTVSYTLVEAPMTIVLSQQVAEGDDHDTLISIENVIGSRGADLIFGNSDANRLEGGDGADELSGDSGDDSLLGGSGDDVLTGGVGSDLLNGGDGYDTAIFYTNFADVRISYVDGGTVISDGQGADTLIGIERVRFADGYRYLTPGGYLLPAGALTVGTDGNDQLAGSAGADNLLGGRGDDVLFGGDGDDFLLGEDGNDQLDGGTGNNSLFGGAGNDTFIWNLQNGLGLTQIDGGSDLNTLDLSGLSSNGAAAPVVSSGPSSDAIQLRLVNGVTVIQAVAVSRFLGGTGTDTYDLGGSTIALEINSGGGDDRILTGSGNDVINAGAGNDVISAGSGVDQIDGGSGNDTAMFGGLSRAYSVRNVPSVQLEVRPPSGPGVTIARAVENLSFVDGVLTFDVDSVAAQVMRLYDATLDRLPDQAGLEFQTRAVSSGSFTLLQLAANFVASPEFQDRYGALSNQAFVEQLYRFCLDREGDAPGIAVQVNALNTGTSRAQLVINFSESPEHRGLTAPTLNAGLWVPNDQALQIARLYGATFDRLPDVGGLTAQLAALVSGVPLLTLAANFAASAEFQARYGALSNQAFVEQLYRFCLDREGDAPGIAVQVNALNNGVSRAQLLLNFSESAEHIALTAPSWSGGIRYVGYVGAAPAEDVDGKDAGPQVSPLADTVQVDVHFDTVAVDKGPQTVPVVVDDFVLPAGGDDIVFDHLEALAALDVFAAAPSRVSPSEEFTPVAIVPDDSVIDALHNRHAHTDWM